MSEGSSPAAIRAVFVDQKSVKGRKVHQLVFEVPAEAANAALAALGGLPNPADATWVGIALLDPLSTVFDKPKAADKPKPSFTEMKRSQQAALRCKEPLFWAFLNSFQPEYEFVASDEDAAKRVRCFCDVNSRSQLDGSGHAARQWDKLEGEYYAWSHGRRT